MATYTLSIPASLTTTPSSPPDTVSPRQFVLGVDEAGRGPVLGPMVYAVCFWPVELQAKMKNSQYNDSKKLTEEDRERLFKAIKQDPDVGFGICSLSAEYLSEQMLKTEPVSLNKIAHDATVELIARVGRAGIDVREIYVDAVGNCEQYQKYLSDHFPNASVTVEAKADSSFKCVSAASICAKVTRDEILANWTFVEQPTKTSPLELTKNWGCGYPGDEKTKSWLAENIDPVFGFPNVVRFSWQTTKTLLDGTAESEPQAARVVFKEEGGATGSSRTITSMFNQATNKRTHYMSSRGVTSNVSFDTFLE